MVRRVTEVLLSLNLLLIQLYWIHIVMNRSKESGLVVGGVPVERCTNVGSTDSLAEDLSTIFLAGYYNIFILKDLSVGTLA
jgi:hypothetical protein